MSSDKRNFNPTPQAILAMTMYGVEYAAQRGGSMDFWDQLDQRRKRLCKDAITRIRRALERKQ